MKGAIKKCFFISILFFCGLCGAFAENGNVTTPNQSALPDIRTPQFDNTSVNRYVNTHPAESISLNFANIKVRELLQVIAQFTKLNFVIDDSVSGEMSIHLHQVPWTQALDVILKSQDLGERRVGNVVYVAPIDTLLKQQITELEARQRMRDLVPLEDRVIHLNYADAVDIQDILVTKNFALLSARGTTNVDKRTNSLWIRDTPEHLKTIVKLIRELDQPVKQVIIEARIVSIKKQFERQLGTRFGLSRPTNNLTGTLTGANSLAQGTSLANVTLANRLNFDSPAGGNVFGSTGAPGTIGLAVAHLGPYFVDLELSALEQENELNIISSPRLITSNQQKAYIQTGEEIPYQQSTSSGAASVAFKDAVLKLEVTPQITPDNRIVLNLKVSNNRPGETIQTGGGGEAIAIVTEEEESRVLLNDNQTVVLGGVYRRTQSNVVQRVPFFGSIPLLGNLFKHTTKEDDKSELLIFLTPHIIKKPSDLSTTY